MPFVKRCVEPVKIRRHQENCDDVFEEHEDVVNNALVAVLRQLSSLTFHAADVFKEAEDEINSLHRRCAETWSKMESLYKKVVNLNPKEVIIPMSDLSTEGKIPLDVHYSSLDVADEELFTIDSRSPWLIRLHSLASDEKAPNVFRASRTFAKSPRDSAINDDLLGDGAPSSGSNATNHLKPYETASIDLVHLYKPKSLLPTPGEKVKQECSQHKAEIVTVDTSGGQFDRRISMRRSCRSSISAVRRKSRLKLNRRATMMAVPVDTSEYSDVSRVRHASSVHSDTHSSLSFTGNASAENTDSSKGKQISGRQIDRVRSLPPAKPQRNFKNRYSMPVVPSGVTSSRRLDIDHVNSTSDSEIAESPAKQKGTVEIKIDVNRDRSERTLAGSTSSDRGNSNQPSNSLRIEDRISSGFWSDSESCRHSTTSETPLQYHVTQSTQKNLLQPPQSARNNNKKSNEDESDASTLSISSRLSALPPSSLSSSFLSIDLASLANRSADDVFTSESALFPKTKKTADSSGPLISVANPNYEQTLLPFLAEVTQATLPVKEAPPANETSKNKLLFSGAEQTPQSYVECVSVKTSLSNHPGGAPQTVSVLSAGISTHSSGTKQNGYFFGPNFPLASSKEKEVDDAKLPNRVGCHGDDLQVELRLRLQKQKRESEHARKPVPPRRSTSLKRPSDGESTRVLLYMEPICSSSSTPSTPSKTTSETQSPGRVEVDHRAQSTLTVSSMFQSTTTASLPTSSLVAASSTALSPKCSPNRNSPSQMAASDPHPASTEADCSLSAGLPNPSGSLPIESVPSTIGSKPDKATDRRPSIDRFKSLLLADLERLNSFEASKNHFNAILPNNKAPSDDATSPQNRHSSRDQAFPPTAAAVELASNHEKLDSGMSEEAKVFLLPSDKGSLNQSPKSPVKSDFNSSEKKVAGQSKLPVATLQAKVEEKSNQVALEMASDQEPVKVELSAAKTLESVSRANGKPAIKPKPKSFSKSQPRDGKRNEPMSKRDWKKQKSDARAAFFGLKLARTSPIQEVADQDSKKEKSSDFCETRYDINLTESVGANITLRHVTHNCQSPTNSSKEEQSLNKPEKNASVSSHARCKTERGVEEVENFSAKVEEALPGGSGDVNSSELKFIDDDTNSGSLPARGDEANKEETDVLPSIPDNSRMLSAAKLGSSEPARSKEIKGVMSSAIINESPPQTSSSPIPHRSGDSSDFPPRESRVTSPPTAAESFKALLLHKHSRSSNLSPTSATEKLKRSAALTLRTNGNSTEARQRMVSVGDIRAALGTSRAGRRPTPQSNRRRPLSEYSTHTSPSLQHVNGRVQSVRVRTPSRMVAIKENSEATDVSSADKLVNSRLSANVTDL